MTVWTTPTTRHSDFARIIIGSGTRDVRIAVLTFTNDLHALAIQAQLSENPGTVCDVIEVDRLADRVGLSWSTSDQVGPTAPSRDGGLVNVAECHAIWYRRFNYPQAAARELTDPVAAEIVNAATPRALLGTLLNGFRGRWVSHPVATQQAENKLLQLRWAQTTGLSVPETLVSNDPDAIRRFCDSVGGRAIMKSVCGTIHSQLFTLDIKPEHLADDDALRLCPTIFQGYVEGSRHLRVLCCGDEVHAVAIDSTELDWRGNLDVPTVPYALDDATARRLGTMLRLMGLRMGVFDLKIDPSGQPVFLELNPQGQFLFVEGLTGMDLIGAFTGFLRAEALAAACE
jgi:glutathione synthase/RimK-type ligase-like ATP-grasp enzyme